MPTGRGAPNADSHPSTVDPHGADIDRTKPGDTSGWSLGRLLSTAARQVEHDWNAALAEHEITHAGLVVLSALQRGALTQRELAAASRVEQQTMSRVISRLERTGHVSRSPDAADRRRRVVTLTPLGRRTFTAVARSDLADRLVTDCIKDPAGFRTELERLVQRSGRSESPVNVNRHR
jgi:DNA-binding MarR family transcriptional regulator